MHNFNAYFNAFLLSARELVSFDNSGPELIGTNYWRLPQARLGQLFLSRSAGVYRLLVPHTALECLDEMRAGTGVTIERSCDRPGWWNVCFEDGSESSWCAEMHPDVSMDFAPAPDAGTLVVYTEEGKVVELPCEVLA